MSYGPGEEEENEGWYTCACCGALCGDLLCWACTNEHKGSSDPENKKRIPCTLKPEERGD